MYDEPYDLDVPTRDERMWAMLCHLSALLGFTVIPFGHILGPLVIWLMKRDESRYLDYHGKEALNFQTSMTIYIIVAAILMFAVIGLLILPVLYVAGFILTIVAAIKANDGAYYRYPLTIRLLK
jgi:uncharacterized protein